MRRKLFGLAALVVGLLLTSGPSAAQPDPELFKLFRPVMRVLGSNPAALLNNAGVQKELKLDEEQVKAVGEMNKNAGFGGFGKGKQDPEAMERLQKMMEKMGQLKDVPEDKLEDKIREVFKEELEGPTKAAEKILKPEQSKRLKQISLQNASLRGLTSTDAADLKLSDDQKSKIQAIATELDKDVAELSPMGKGGFGGGGRVSPETREKIANLRKEAMEKATEVLSADQKTKWKDLTGEPFEVKFDFARPKKKDD